ncbi:glutathione S-transferase family protein [Maricaulis sp. CAU 1757]
MKFYDCKTAPSPRRARIFMAEKGLEVETEQVDLAARAQFSDAYRAVNPRCTVPSLVLDDGIVLCDNASIARYLEDMFPEPPLLGTHPVERALVAEWWSRVEWEGLMAVAEVLRNTSDFFQKAALPGPRPYEQIPQLAERGRERATAFLAEMNQRLGNEAYLAGERFSAADIAAFVFVDFAKWVKIRASEDQVHLARWYEAVAARPSASA